MEVRQLPPPPFISAMPCSTASTSTGSLGGTGAWAWEAAGGADWPTAGDAGFGGGGVHGYAALEGTFLGGCIFSGRAAGRAAARAVA